MSQSASPLALALALAVSACATPVQPVPASAPTSSSDPAETTGAGPYACHKVSGKVSASFKSGVTLDELVAWAMAFSCKNIVYRADTGCAKVRILAPAAMGVPQAWNLFVSAVESLGLEVRERGDSVAVVGVAKDGACTSDRPPARRPKKTFGDSNQKAWILAKVHLGVTQIDATTFEVQREVFSVIERNIDAVLRGARVVPSIKNGQPNGLKLYAIRPTSAYAVFGFRNGDTVHRINGIELDSPAKALEALKAAKTAKSIRIEITRRGKPFTLLYSIE